MNTWTTIVVALIGGGFLQYTGQALRLAYKKMKGSTPEARQQQQIHDNVIAANESVLVVAKARGELAADNDRLRLELIETNRRHAADRLEWAKERTALNLQAAQERAEHRAEMVELKQEFDELEMKWRAALDELANLRAKHPGLN